MNVREMSVGSDANKREPYLTGERGLDMMNDGLGNFRDVCHSISDIRHNAQVKLASFNASANACFPHSLVTARPNLFALLVGLGHIARRRALVPARAWLWLANLRRVDEGRLTLENHCG